MYLGVGGSDDVPVRRPNPTNTLHFGRQCPLTNSIPTRPPLLVPSTSLPSILGRSSHTWSSVIENSKRTTGQHKVDSPNELGILQTVSEAVSSLVVIFNSTYCQAESSASLSIALIKSRASKVGSAYPQGSRITKQTLGGFEPQFVFTLGTKLGRILVCEDVALEISKVHRLGTMTIIPHPCTRSNRVSDESGPHWCPTRVSLNISRKILRLPFEFTAPDGSLQTDAPRISVLEHSQSMFVVIVNDEPKKSQLS